jgi:hypothetical protein
MKQDNVHVKIVPDIRRIKTASKYPLKLRISYKSERKYYATGPGFHRTRLIDFSYNSLVFCIFKH